MLKILAPAKVNLCLEILGKRPDGYHEIDTVMQAVSLFDEIIVQDADDIQLTCDIDLGPPASNLVQRAAELLRQRHAPDRGAKIHLTKRIPHGAGLGGGSSDAANTLVALNRLWKIGLGNDRLRELATELGSDCPFFVEGGLARCRGRGEIVKPLADLPELNFVLLYPNEVTPTVKVYAALGQDLTNPASDCYFTHDIKNGFDRREFASRLINHLEKPALEVSARLREVWGETASEQGALARLVSGSGSTIAFLTGGWNEAAALAAALDSRGLGQVFDVRSLPRGTVWG